MKVNMGSSDRITRLVIAIVIVVLYLTDVISGTLAIIGLIVAAIFLLTSFVRICPLYSILGINTCGKRKNLPTTLND